MSTLLLLSLIADARWTIVISSLSGGLGGFIGSYKRLEGLKRNLPLFLVEYLSFRVDQKEGRGFPDSQEGGKGRMSKIDGKASRKGILKALNISKVTLQTHRIKGNFPFLQDFAQLYKVRKTGKTCGVDEEEGGEILGVERYFFPSEGIEVEGGKFSY